MQTTSLFAFIALSLVGPASAAPLITPATGATKGGLPVVAASTSSSWTTAVLQIQLAVDDVSPHHRTSTTSYMAALADVGERVLGRGGRVEGRVGADVMTLAFGAPADQPELALRAVDAVLRAVKTVKPTEVLPPDDLDVIDAEFDSRTAGLLQPGHPSGTSVSNGTMDAAAFKALGDTVFSNKVAIGVVGPGTPAEVLARAIKVVGARLPRFERPGPGFWFALPRTLTIEHGGMPHEPPLFSTMTWFTSTPLSSSSRAAAMVLAQLIGSQMTVVGSEQTGIIVVVRGDNDVELRRAEHQKIEQLHRLSRTPPTPDELATAVSAVQRTRLARLDDPTRLAAALSRALLNGADAAADLAAVESVDGAAVSAAAMAFRHTLVLERPAPTTPEPADAPPIAPAPKLSPGTKR